MAGGGVGQRACNRIEDPDERRDERIRILRFERAIRRVEHRDRIGIDLRDAADDLAHRSHDHRRGKAASRDVADREHDASVGEPQRVVPIAAELLAIAGGDVDPVERNAGNLGQRNRQGGALKLRRDLAFAFVEPRVLDCDRGAFGQLFEERQVVVAVAARRLGPKRDERTDRPASGTQRNRHRGTRRELAEYGQQIGSRGSFDELLADFANDIRPIRPENRSDIGFDVWIVVVTAEKTLDEARLFRVRMNDGDGLEPAGLVEEIDRSPIAELRYDDREQAVERRLQIERFGEHLAGLRKKGEALTLSLVIVDIGADSKPALRSRRGFDRRDVHGEPAVLAVGTAQSQLELKGCEALHPVSHGLPRSPKIFSIDGRRPLLL